jgi:hypothetical protein
MATVTFEPDDFRWTADGTRVETGPDAGENVGSDRLAAALAALHNAAVDQLFGIQAELRRQLRYALDVRDAALAARGNEAGSCGRSAASSSARCRMLTTALEAIDRANRHEGLGPHCTCSQAERERIVREALERSEPGR